MSLEILTQPAQFNSTVDVLSGVKAATIELTNSEVQTLYSPATATGAFLLLSVNGINKAIQLWDYIPQILAIRFTNATGDGDWANLLNWTDDKGRSPVSFLPLGDFNVQIYGDITQNTDGDAIANTYSFYDSANNYITLTAGSSFTFYNQSSNLGTLIGTANFLGNSSNSSNFDYTGTVQGNANFYNNSSNKGLVQGDADVYYPTPSPLGGTVTGTITYHGYPVRFINSTGDGDWSNLNNWTDDVGSPALYLPTSAIDVKIYDKVTKVTQGNAIAHNANFFGDGSLEQVSLRVANSAVFHGSTYNYGSISGNAVFLDSSSNGSLTQSVYETVIMCNFGGENGSQEFPDISKYTHSITYSGSPFISNEHGLFNEDLGGGTYDPPSLRLDGSSYLISQPTSNEYVLGTEDFTVEFWFYIDSRIRLYPTILSNSPVSWSNGAISFCVQHNSFPNDISIHFNENGSANEISSNTNSLTENVWHHAAFVREAGTVSVYLDGILRGSGSMNGSMDLSFGDGMRIGGGSWGGIDSCFNGWLEDLRIIKGKALYTSNFILPTVKLEPIDGFAPVIVGNAGFVSNATNVGNISGNGIFDGSSSNGLNKPGYVLGSAIFKGTSKNSSVVATSAIFSGYSTNMGSVSGVADFYGNSNNGELVDTLLLMHFDESYGSQNFVDSSTHNTTFSWDGYPYIDNATSVFGGTSLYIDGYSTSIYPSSNGGELAFGTDDFTIEFWVYPQTTPYGNTVCVILDYRTSGVAGYPVIYLNNSYLRYFNNGDVISGDYLNTSTWYHIALTRNGNSTKMFINGNQTGSTYNDTNNYQSSTNRPLIGNSFDNYPFAGYIDELRIVKGKALYTSNFTPPDAPLSVTSGIPGLVGDLATFNDYSHNNNGVEDAVFNDYSYNNGSITNGTFYNTSYNNGLVASGVFYDTSYNGINGVVNYGVFQANSRNYGYTFDAHVYYPSHYPIEGGHGTVTYYGYAFGCTDPNATNYDPNANTNDGSCTYPTGGLTENIFSYWKLDESSTGTRADATPNGNDLLDTNNNVTSGNGIVNSGAQFNQTYLELN
ncbi:MAG: LamG domain-containing protein [Proteobacteria bacterium]|nr:LamG domain-containing protein [Pseudomonadota bacterium]NBP12881.1 LamG domain-containing protein [bacterium]